MNRLGCDSQGSADPPPRPPCLARCPNLPQQLFVQQVLKLPHNVQAQRRPIHQRTDQLDHLVVSLHPEIIANRSQKRQESHGY